MSGRKVATFAVGDRVRLRVEAAHVREDAELTRVAESGRPGVVVRIVGVVSTTGEQGCLVEFEDTARAKPLAVAALAKNQELMNV